MLSYNQCNQCIHHHHHHIDLHHHHHHHHHPLTDSPDKKLHLCGTIWSTISTLRSHPDLQYDLDHDGCHDEYDDYQDPAGYDYHTTMATNLPVYFVFPLITCKHHQYHRDDCLSGKWVVQIHQRSWKTSTLAFSWVIDSHPPPKLSQYITMTMMPFKILCYSSQISEGFKNFTTFRVQIPILWLRVFQNFNFFPKP